VSSRKIYAVESHEQNLEIWRRARTRQAKVLHVDFHCDLRGMLIDRKNQRGYRIWDRYWRLNEGNFLTHAIVEGVVSEIRWVHDEPGGRIDDLKIVKYKTDLSAQVHRLMLALRRDPGIPIRFEVMTSEQWDGVHPGEILDIDWDYFACLDYDADSIPQRVDDFLTRDFANVPEQTFVCHSPEYCHPTRQEFESFVKTLAERFAAEIVWVPKPSKQTSPSSLKKVLGPIYQPLREFYRTTCLALHRHGIY
jgi:hypothetical protein